MRSRSLYFSILSICCLICISLPAFSQKPGGPGDGSPQIFQVTTAETLPGDAVLIRGEFLNTIDRIQVCRLSDKAVENTRPDYVPLPREDALPGTGVRGERVTGVLENDVIDVKMIQQRDQSVKFLIPKHFKKGVYSVRLTDDHHRATGFYVNVPVVNWVISEAGLKAVAGDYLRIQGKNLWKEGYTGEVALVSADGHNIIRAKVKKVFDPYSVRVDIPATTDTGSYQLFFHNGEGGKTAWSVPINVLVVQKPKDRWDDHIINVKDFGAKGDGSHNETDAFRAALYAAGKDGGGTVFVPRGRYMLTGEIKMAPYTMLKGESESLTQLFWSPLNWDTNEMPNSLISGTHDFAIKDLNLWSSRAWGIIMQTGPVEDQGNVTLDSLVVRQSAELSGMVYQVKANRDIVEAEIMSRWTKTGIILRGPNLKVRNCDFNTSGMYTFFAASGFIQHSTFTRRGTGINQPYMLVHPKGLIFEDCYKQSDGYGYCATIDESHDLYEARNIIPFNYTNDREAMTFDGGSGAYSGKIERISGTTLILPKNAETYQWTPDKWIGGGLFILEGKGAGQYRRIVHHSLDTIHLDQPFLVDPDSTSVISITTIRRNLFYINNEVTDAGAYQFYGSAQNCVISGLKMRRCNGIVGRGSYLYHGMQPNWYIDIVNCEFKEGNYSHWFGIDDRGHSGHQNIKLIGSGGTGLNIGTLIRRNRLYDFSYIQTSPGGNANSITDVIIEDNYFTTAEEAIVLRGTDSQTSSVLIHHNHYTDVKKRISSDLNPASYFVLDDGASPKTKEIK